MLALFSLLREGLLAAIAILSLAPQGNVTAADAATLGICLVDASRRHELPWQQLAAVVHHESMWRRDARSHTNDYGLGQIHCPSKYCRQKPTPEELARLFDGCTNLGYSAELLASKKAICRKVGGACSGGGYIRFYNPGSEVYLSAVLRIERRIQRVF